MLSEPLAGVGGWISSGGRTGGEKKK